MNAGDAACTDARWTVSSRVPRDLGVELAHEVQIVGTGEGHHITALEMATWALTPKHSVGVVGGERAPPTDLSRFLPSSFSCLHTLNTQTP